jgi:AraC-like DNA-binding protein
MNVLFNYERLLPLISSLYVLSGIRADLYDLDFREVFGNNNRQTPFCTLINACPEGHARCVACDREAMKQARSGKPFSYRCHAGLCEAILPICQGNTPLAFLFYGQYLDDSGVQEQWERTRATLSWYPGDMEQLYQAFCELREYSRREVEAFSEILWALASYIQLKGIVLSPERTDLQRLEEYIEQHFTEKLSLDQVAEALHMGRTKLCALAKELSGGDTLSKMITQRRIREAKELLRQSDMPVSAVAEAVGISDYNYFTKVFRGSTGKTPTDYRRSARRSRAAKSIEQQV